LRNQVATWREQDEHLVEWSPKKWFLGKTTVRLPRQFLALFCIFLHYLASNINDLRGGQKIRDAGVAGSNPATPTKQSPGAFAFFPERFQGQPPKRAVSRRAPGTGPDQSAFCRIGKQATTMDRTGPGIADQETGD
jgi:hypothetical protein